MFRAPGPAVGHHAGVTNMERIERMVARLPEARRVDIEAWDGDATFRVRGKNFVFAGTDADRMVRVIWLSLAFFLVSIPCMSAWAYLGVSAARFCRSAQSMKRFNQAMAVLLLVSAWLTLVV